MESYQRTTTAEPGTNSEASGRSATALASGKADLGKRFVAIIIDCVISGAVGLIPVIGWLIGAAYMVVRDGLDFDYMRQRSVGKHLMGLHPVRLDGQPMTIETSIRRNWMFGLGGVVAVLALIPIIGWMLIPVVGIVAFGVGVYEIYRVLTDPEGRRLGDTMAGTKVVEADVTSPVT